MSGKETTVAYVHEAGEAFAELPGLELVGTAPGRAPKKATLGLEPVRVGSAPNCQLVLEDATVSRAHCEVLLTPDGVRLRDLESRNGTRVGGAWLKEAWLEPGVTVTLGSSQLTLSPAGAPARVPLSSSPQFGEAVGASLPMRALFAQLERAAQSDETVLLQGESGTGKDVLARALHERGARREGPFVVVDCGAIPPSLVEAELFGAEPGAYTGVAGPRMGLLESADGGTLFLDEVGELPLEIQPKLLRFLETRKVRRVGGIQERGVQVRVVAATHRTLRAAAESGDFRLDLYFRLAVLEFHFQP